MSISIPQLKDHSISVDHTGYDTSVGAKYLDTYTLNKSTNFYKITFPSDMIFTKDDVSTSDEKFDNLSREFNIHYRACIGSLIYLLSTSVYLVFVVQKLAKFSSNPGKVRFEGLVYLLRYIRGNKTFRLKYYIDIKYAPLSDLLIQASINTENQLMVFSDSIFQDCPATGRSTVSYILFYQGGTIYHGTHVPGPVYQSSA